jgi:hypothetical protein
MRECVRMFGQRRGDEVHEMIEESTGATCPCLAGDVCPLVSPRKVPATLSLIVPAIAPLLGSSGHPAVRRLPVLCLPMLEFVARLWS